MTSQKLMKITEIRETSVALNSTLKNSSIDFSEMTTSVVAVITDALRDGKPVVGFAFNSTGRYACGAQMRARFIPRILKAEPASLLNQAGDNFDAGKILVVMMRNEKSGGHSERSVGIGTIETALWDVIAKIEDKPLHVVLAERHGGVCIALVRGAVRSARLRDARRDLRRLSGSDLDRREFVLHAGREKPGALRRPQGAAPRRDPGRPAAGLRHRAICPHAQRS